MLPDKGRIAFATALISYAVLTFEIVLTRIFSVMLSYHYVFAVVSFSLFGLGLGGMLWKKWERYVGRNKFHISALFFALMIDLAVLSVIKLPLYESDILIEFGFWFYIAQATLPFIFAGLTLAGIFANFARFSSIIYGFDLIGATLGSLSVVILLNIFGGVKASFVIAGVASLSALLLAWNGRIKWSMAVIGVLGSILLVPLIFNLNVPVAKDPNKDMYRYFSNPLIQSELVESRWSAFGRTDLVRTPNEPDAMTIFVDGAAGSPMYNFKLLTTDSSRIAHLFAHYGAYFPFFFLTDEEKDNALILGSGGGRDVVVSLIGGVKFITAVEVNPDVVQIVKDYEDYNGGIYTRFENVRVIVAEGRSYVRSDTSKYDIIMLSLPITKSSRSIEGYALTENYLFTVEAFLDYFNHLTPEGRLIIVAHTDEEIYRLISLALSAFKIRSIPELEAMKHIYTIASGLIPTMVIKNTPFDSVEIVNQHNLAHRLGYDLGSFFMPYIKQLVVDIPSPIGLDMEWRMFNQILVDIAEGDLNLEQMVKSAMIDISPVTDDSPFFYKFELGLPKPFGIFAWLIILTFGILIALVAGRRRQDLQIVQESYLLQLTSSLQLKLALFIFFCLGMGFMMIEIALFQKLTLYIGQPILTLTLLLFSLLLGSGLGSLFSSLFKTQLHKKVAVLAFLISFLVMIYVIGLTRFFNLQINPNMLTVALLLPLGFLMGMPFPLAIRIMKNSNAEPWIHLMWGVNGIASVLGSAFAMIIGILFGFSYAIMFGAIFYLLIAVLALWNHHKVITN